MTQRQNIENNVERNLGRVKNLTTLYKDKLSGSGSGRRPVNSADVLRAATVMLHATLEDFLRDLARWKLPLASHKELTEIPIASSNRRVTKFTLSSVARHRGKTVDDLITESIFEYLENETYNNIPSVRKLLSAIGTDENLIDPYSDAIGNMMSRRHHIVHRADKNEASGAGHYSAKSIGHATVVSWIYAVESFSFNVLEAV